MFSERLKAVRNSKGLMQRDIAEYLSIVPKAYQKYEYGIREPSFEILTKLCQFLEVSADYLLGLSDTPSRLP